MIRKLRIPTFVTLLAAFTLAACGDDPFVPTMDSIAGEYRATTLTATTGGVTVDALALGGTLTLDLDEDGTTTGRLFLPGLEEDGSDFDASLDGTWQLRGDVVTFDQGADTLIRDLEFEVRGSRLEAEETFSGGDRVRVVLSKQ